jgi:hypothetical protein
MWKNMLEMCVYIIGKKKCYWKKIIRIKLLIKMLFKIINKKYIRVA